MAKKIFVPAEIPQNYKYMGNITNTYFDIYDRENIRNQSGTYYRIYYGLDPSYWEQYSYTGSSYYETTYQEFERTSSFLARPDNYKIVTVGFCIIFLIILLTNVITSIVKRGGVLGGLL